MSTTLSPPQYSVFQQLHQPSPGNNEESRKMTVPLAPILCGGLLVVYGLWRGSWLGLTLAAAGGFLLYRGVKPLLAPVTGGGLPLL